MKKFISLIILLFASIPIFASEASLTVADLTKAFFPHLRIDGNTLLLYCMGMISVTIGLSMYHFKVIKNLPTHYSLENVSIVIYKTCITYLKQIGKFILKILIADSILIIVYLMFTHSSVMELSLMQLIYWVLITTVLGAFGAFFVAWYGIRVNNYANSRNPFAALTGKPLNVVMIPLRAGISIGLLMISVELIAMMCILLFVPREAVGICFIGFALGESSAASGLRIGGGIFTKIADIGADLMKIIFQLDEDDPRNPGVIADCVGDNAGDSVGPTADGFETFGVTGIANIIFITVSIGVLHYQPEPELAGRIITTLFVLRCFMDAACAITFSLNQALSIHKYSKVDDFNFENPLTSLIRITAIVSIIVCLSISYIMLGDLDGNLWLGIASPICFGILGALLLPEATKEFTSSNSKHVHDIIESSKVGGPSLTILTGLAIGFISAFWNTLVIIFLVASAIKVNSLLGIEEIIPYADIFCNGLIAFGFLSMGAVNIAVDSYGPVSDNAQSIYKLSRIRHIPGIEEEIERDYGFRPDFEKAEYFLEKNDAAGNTFKATTKPVLIATAIVGVTMIIHSIVALLEGAGMLELSIMSSMVLLGLMTGGAMISWFSGAAIKGVTIGAHKTTNYIQNNIELDGQSANENHCKAVVKICTLYAEEGAWNIIVVMGSVAIAAAFINPSFCIAYLISIAVFGLLQAMNTANAGGAWDNAKKVVESIKEFLHTALHQATVIGDTVGDPYKDTLAVTLNPAIKFSTMLCVFALEIAKEMSEKNAQGSLEYTYKHTIIALVFGAIALFYAWKQSKARVIIKDSETKKHEKVQMAA